MLKSKIYFVWEDKDWETFSLQGKVDTEFNSLCLQDDCFLIASLSAFGGKRRTVKRTKTVVGVSLVYNRK